ncbi:MAG: Ig-like domain-containing protein [Nitrospinae bacterium]|nr:Ig-like domain-containing protein [Nitrospinota bacterium]
MSVTSDKGVFTADGAKSTTAKTSLGTGRAAVQFFSEPNVFGTATIVASAGGVTQSLRITLIGPGPPAKITLTTDATSILVSGTTKITAQVVDAQGNSVANGTVITFTPTLAGTTVTPTTATTTNGVATATLTAGTVVGTTGVTASAGTAAVGLVSATTSLTVLEVAGITLTAGAPSLVANGSSSTTLTATMLTTTGATAPDGIVVTFTTDKGRFTIAGAKSATATTRGGTGAVVVPFLSEDAAKVPNAVGTASIVATINTVAQSTQIALTGAGPPTTIILTADATSISVGGTTAITAQVLDAVGNKVSDGTAVSFTSSLAGTGITPSVTTSKGVATALFSAGTKAGVATVSATSGSATAAISITITPGDAGSLEFVSADPTVVGVRGSALTQKSTITFRARDINGNPVRDGTQVTFTLISGAGGGETIAPTTVGTVAGLAATILTSGTVAGPVRVQATVTVGTTTLSSSSTNVSIAGGSPSAAHFGLARQFVNVAGQVFLGIKCSVTALVGDRFGNPVPQDTAVSFETNGGVIGAQGKTDALGIATTTLVTGPPIPFVASSPDAGTDARTGFVTVTSVTQGEETFVDSNGNGVFDGPAEFPLATNPELDTPEPFIDHVTLCTELLRDGTTRACQTPADPTLFRGVAGNGQFDATDRFELFIDANGNGVWNLPNGIWDSSKPIFTSARVLLSGPTVLRVTRLQADGSCQGDPSGFFVPNGGGVPFCILVSDPQGHPLVSGTTLTVTTTVGAIAGTSSVTLPDTQQMGPGITFFTFSVVDTDPEPASGTTPANNNPPVGAGVTVRVTSPSTGTCPGGNGNASFSFSGQVD